MGLAKAGGLYQGNGCARLERMPVLARLGHFLNDIVAAYETPSNVGLVKVACAVATTMLAFQGLQLWWTWRTERVHPFEARLFSKLRGHLAWTNTP